MLKIVLVNGKCLFPQFHVEAKTSQVLFGHTRFIKIFIVEVVEAAVILLNHVAEPVEILNVPT